MMTHILGDQDLPDEEGMSRMREMFGPHAVDYALRQAISMCWMTLPSGKRNIDELERQIRRLVDRALQNARDDGAQFGMTNPPPSTQG